METRAGQYNSIKNSFAFLTVNLLALGAAEYVNRHRHHIQSKTYEHPRLGGSSIRYCAFNQYFDDREGRCMIIPGGGMAISIDEGTTCSIEALRGDPHRSRNYYICRKRNTILAECKRGKRFDNRLKRCMIDGRPSIDEEDDDSHHYSYDHLHLPACQTSGRFPVPQDNCTLFYSCTSNGFRLFRTIHKCPASTGFDPFEGICTTARACNKDELGPTTVADNRAKIYGSTTGVVVKKTTGTSIEETPTSGYDEAKISFNMTSLGTFTTEKMTTATSPPDSSGEIVDIARTTRPRTEVYDHGEETSPSTSTTYVHSLRLSEQMNTSERSPIVVAANQIVHTSTASTVLSDRETTENTFHETDGMLHNSYSNDYATLRRNDTPKQETKIENTTETPVTISTNNKNDEFINQTTMVDVQTEKQDEARTSASNKFGIGLRVSYSTESVMDNASEKWLFDKYIDGPTPTIIDEMQQRGITEQELGTSVPTLLSGTKSDATTNDIQYEKVQFITTPSALSSIGRSSAFVEGLEINSTPEAIFLNHAVTWTTPDDSYTSSGAVSGKSLSSDEIGGTSISTEIDNSTPITLTSFTPLNNEATSTQVSNWSTEEQSTVAASYHDSFGSLSDNTSDDEKSTILSTESAMSTTAYISEVTEKSGSTPPTFTSLTMHNNEATSFQDSDWTTEAESTMADRYHDTFSSLPTDSQDNKKSTTDGAESTMSPTERTHINEVTEQLDSTPATLTSLTSRNDEATSTEPNYISEVTDKFDSTPVPYISMTTQNNEVTGIQESDRMTEKESNIADRHHHTFKFSSTDEPDYEISTSLGTLSAITTTDSVQISQVTENVGTYSEIIGKSSSTDDLSMAIDQQQSTTSENSYPLFTYSSASDPSQFDIAHTSEDSTSGTNIAISTGSILPVSSEPSQRTNGLVLGSYTTLPQAFTPFSTFTPDYEKSTNGIEWAMSTTEPVHVSEVTEDAVTNSKITWNSNSTDDPFTSHQLRQSTIAKDSQPLLTYSTFGLSQFGTDQTTEGSGDPGIKSNPEMNVTVPNTSITPPPSESSQLDDGQAQASYTWASSNSGYATTVESSAVSTTSLTTMIPFSLD